MTWAVSVLLVTLFSFAQPSTDAGSLGARVAYLAALHEVLDIPLGGAVWLGGYALPCRQRGTLACAVFAEDGPADGPAPTELCLAPGLLLNVLGCEPSDSGPGLRLPPGQRFTEWVTAQAALRAESEILLASLTELWGDDKAADKHREAAADALELALTDRNTARAFLQAARELIARPRPRPRPMARGSDQDDHGSPGDEPDPGSSRESLAAMRAGLRTH